MARWMLATVGWLLFAACGGEAEPAKDGTHAESTAGHERGSASPPPLPAPYEATFTQTVSLPFSAIGTAIDAQLPRRDSQPSMLLTKPGHSPEVTASYELWRDPVSVRFDGATLWVEVPLRYAAIFSARVKNPFGGWLKLADNETWGTHQQPQRITMTIRTSVQLTADWQLRLDTAVDPPRHDAPPDGKVCTGGGFKLCVDKASLAPEVRRRIDGEIVPRVRDALIELDHRIEQSVNLRARAEHAWQQLAEPRALGAYDRYSVLEPRQVALELRAEPQAVAVDAAVFGRLSVHQGKPAVAAPPALPERAPLASLPGPRKQDRPLIALEALVL